MPHGFRPTLEPPSSRRVETETRKPCMCAVITFGVALLVLTIFGVSAWNVYQHRFHKNTFYFHQGDEVALSQVSGDLSSTFCEAYKVSLWAAGDVYLLPHHPTVNKTISETTPVQMHQLPQRAYNVKSAYLLKGSVVNVSACRENGSAAFDADIVFIRGSGNFKDWRKDNDCDKCVVERVPIPSNADCHNVTAEARLVHTVDRNDKYFLVMTYGKKQQVQHERDSGILLRGSIGRTHYKITDAEKQCHIAKDSSCQFDLPWLSDKDIVVKFEYFRGMNFRRTLITQCHIRTAFWIGMFGALPIVCIIPISILFGCFLCRRRPMSEKEVQRMASHRERKAKSRKQDREELVHNEVVQGAEGGNMGIQDV